jgi:hypothetical protein
MHSKNFAFKCHRDVARDTSSIHAVNAISFHPGFGTFSTAGSVLRHHRTAACAHSHTVTRTLSSFIQQDGTFHFWDKDSRQRIHRFQKMPQPISCTAFNFDGSIFAYACSYEWSRVHSLCPVCVRVCVRACAVFHDYGRLHSPDPLPFACRAWTTTTRAHPRTAFSCTPPRLPRCRIAPGLKIEVCFGQEGFQSCRVCETVQKEKSKASQSGVCSALPLIETIQPNCACHMARYFGTSHSPVNRGKLHTFGLFLIFR